MKSILHEDAHVCPKCGKEVCECNLSEDIEEVEVDAEEQIEAPEETTEAPEEPASEQIPETEEETAEPEIEEKAFTDLFTKLVQDEWNLISNINAAISTIDYGYHDENRDNIKKILEEIINDSTINIGMLYKVIELISSRSTELIDNGTAKAEEIIEEPSVE